MHKGALKRYGEADEVVDAYSEFLEVGKDDASALEDL
jgi:hypothetical protein